MATLGVYECQPRALMMRQATRECGPLVAGILKRLYRLDSERANDNLRKGGCRSQ
jgi:hypothetical protein